MKLRRTYLKQTVASKLYPDSINANSAMQALRREIRATPQLNQRLLAECSKEKLHYYTRKQFLILLDHFCITQEEFELL